MNTRRVFGRRVAPLPARPTTALIGRVHPATDPAPPTRAVRAVRRGRRIGGWLVIGALAMGITALSSPDGSIAHADGVCIDTSESNTWGPDGIRTGVDGMIGQAGPAGGFGDPLPAGYASLDEAINDTTHTDYEKLGTAGALFSVDYGSQDSDDNACFPVAKVVGNFLANSLFNIDKVFARLAISTYQWATNPGVLAPLNEPLDEVTASFWDGGLQYLLGACILIGVATLLWIGLVRRRFMLMTGGIIWMVAATAVLLLFLAKPSAIPSKLNETVAELTNFSFTSGTTNIETVDPHVAATYSAVRAQPNAGQRIASDMMWRVMVYQPWLAGQWGDSSSAPVYMTTTPYPADTPPGWYDGTRDAHYQQLYAQACVLDSAVSICDQRDDIPNAPDIPAGGTLTGAFVNQYAQHWYMVENWTCTSADYCIGPVGNPDNGDDDDEREVDTSNGWQYRSTWSGDQPEQRMLAALTGLVATIALGGIIFVLSAVVICYDLVLYMLCFLGIFLLLLGIQPTWGRKLVEGLGWQIVQNGLKRVMAGVLVSLLIVVYGVIQGTTLGWAQQIGLMLGVGVAVMLVRKPLMATVGGVGGQAGALAGVEDAATDKTTSTTQRGTSTAMKKSSSATATGAGAVAGAPLKGRRAVIGAREGAAVARQRAQTLGEQGTPLTPGQQRRTRTAAAAAGAKAGAASSDRTAAERNASRFAGTVVARREGRYERADERKFARTEQGRAVATARQAQAAQHADQATAQRLQDRDDAIRVAATTNPKRFSGTAQNFDGYATGADGQTYAEYVDRNTRRPTGPTRGRHSEHTDTGAVLRGPDPLPTPVTPASNAEPPRRDTPLRSTPAWKPEESSNKRVRGAGWRPPPPEDGGAPPAMAARPPTGPRTGPGPQSGRGVPATPDVSARVIPRVKPAEPSGPSVADQQRERIRAAREGTANVVNAGRTRRTRPRDN